jgi:hypothetical protein
VHIKGKGSFRSQRFYDWETESDVGSEATVNDVKVNPVSTTSLKFSDNLTKPSEIGRKDGGRNFQLPPLVRLSFQT